MSSVQWNDDAKRFFRDAERLRNLQAQLVNDEPYVEELDRGSSEQAPQGIVRAFVPEYRGVILSHIENALDGKLEQLGQALDEGFSAGVEEVLRRVERRTPVKSGEARRSWRAILPDGRVIAAGPVPIPARMTRRRRRA